LYFSYFSEACFCPRLDSDQDPPTYASHVAETIGYVTIPGLLRWGLTNFLPRLASNLDLLDLLLPEYLRLQAYAITPGLF
jgi:hypothetical protein